jgi:ABC-type lipoprotein export system ATPase subunit
MSKKDLAIVRNQKLGFIFQAYNLLRAQMLFATS